MIRRLGVAGLAFAALISGGSPALAHGPEGLAFQGVSGPYLLSVFDGRSTGRAGQAEFRVVVSKDPGDGRLGEGAPLTAVPDATVTVIEQSGRSHRAEAIGNVHFVVLPDRSQQVDVRISSPAGSTTVTTTVHGPTSSSDDGWPPAVWVLLAAASAAAVGIAARALLRRRRDDAPAT